MFGAGFWKGLHIGSRLWISRWGNAALWVARLSGHRPTSEESIMGVIAWIVLGAVAGLIAEHLTGRKTGLMPATVIGIAGALLGGFLAKTLLGIQTLDTFFNLSTWITAIIGAVVLFLLFGAIRGRAGPARRSGLAPRRLRLYGRGCRPRYHRGTATSPGRSCPAGAGWSARGHRCSAHCPTPQARRRVVCRWCAGNAVPSPRSRTATSARRAGRDGGRRCGSSVGRGAGWVGACWGTGGARSGS